MRSAPSLFTAELSQSDAPCSVRFLVAFDAVCCDMLLHKAEGNDARRRRLFSSATTSRLPTVSSFLSPVLFIKYPTMSCRVAMSLRTAVVGTGRNFVAATASSTPTYAFARAPARSLSSSSVTRLATPQTGPTRAGYGPIPEHGTGSPPIVPKRAEVVADYSQGPSALDKASSLFFFTEIVRGELVVGLAPVASVTASWAQIAEIRTRRLVNLNPQV